MFDWLYIPLSALLWVCYLPFRWLPHGTAWLLAAALTAIAIRAALYPLYALRARQDRANAAYNTGYEAAQAGLPPLAAAQALAAYQAGHRRHALTPWVWLAALQIAAILCMYHVLRSFDRAGTRHGQVGLSPTETWELPNYVVPVWGVREHLHARAAGAPPAAYPWQPPPDGAAYTVHGGSPYSMVAVWVVCGALAATAALLTWQSARDSIARQGAAGQALPYARQLDAIALYVAPAGMLLAGYFLPATILAYIAANIGCGVVQARRLTRYQTTTTQTREATP